MVSDRVANLLVQASASNIINFKEAKLLDHNWWRKVKWLLNQVEIKELKNLLNLKFTQHANALNYQAGKESFEHHWKQLNELYIKILNLTFPWNKDEADFSDDKLKDLWVKMAGNPDQESIDALTKKLTDTNPTPNVNTGEACLTSRRPRRKLTRKL